MSLYHKNVEAIGKLKKCIFFLNLKKITSPAYEFLLHKCKNNRDMQKLKKNIIRKKIYKSS